MSIPIRYYLVILFCTTGCTTSQATSDDSERLQDLKFQMIKKAVAFYSLDPTLHPNKPAPDCLDASNIPDLAICAQALKGVKQKIADFDHVAVTNSEDLVQLKQEIIKQVASKKYRTKIRGYDTFLKDLDALTTGWQPAAQAFVPEVKVNNPVVAKSAPATAIAKSQDVAEWNIWNIVAIGLSTIAVLLSLLLRRGKKKRTSTTASFSNNVPGNSSKEGSEFLFEDLKGRFITLEERVGEVERKLRGHSDYIDQKQTQATAVYQTTQYPVNRVKYAKTADGDSFPVDALSDIQDNKKIFEITILGPDKGSFIVTTNKEAQLFALEDPNNYLRGACNYKSLPTFDSTIITDSPGRLELNGNKWSIVTRAEIDFS